jgi:DNA ligase 1
VIEVVFKRGLYLPEFDFWLDPRDAKQNAFISHAHADHFARHEHALCTALTANLLKARFNMADSRIETAGFGEIIDRDTFRLRMLPAGHIVGSAMLHVTRKRDGATLLCTGDFKVRRGRTTEAVNFMQADTLIMETTFGLPSLVLPSALEVDAMVLRFVHDALSDGDTPVLFGYSLGKAQEALALLNENGIPVLSHPKIAEMTEVCRAAGIELPEPELFEGFAKPGYAILAPPNALGAKILRGLRNKRTAMLTGWALQPRSAYRYKADAIIPLSDHADHVGLHECVTRVRPKRVLTVHGYSKEFAAELRAKGIEAWCASGGDQLELSLEKLRFSAAVTLGARHSRPICQFADFTDACRLISETNSRAAKIDFLSHYLGNLESNDLGIVVSWLLEPRILKKSLIQISQLKRSLEFLSGVQIDRIKQLFCEQNDTAKAARLVLQELNLSPKPFLLSDIRDFLLKYSNLAGSLRSLQFLSDRLIEMHPSESESLLRLLLSDLRLGLLEGDVEDSLCVVFKSNACLIRKTHLLTRDLSRVAILAKEGRLSEARLTPMQAIIPMQALRFKIGDSESLSALSFSAPYWLERIYSGLRVQLHKQGAQVIFYGNDAQELGDDFPELVAAAKLLKGDLIIDTWLVFRQGGETFSLNDQLNRNNELFSGI